MFKLRRMVLSAIWDPSELDRSGRRHIAQAWNLTPHKIASICKRLKVEHFGIGTECLTASDALSLPSAKLQVFELFEGEATVRVTLGEQEPVEDFSEFVKRAAMLEGAALSHILNYFDVWQIQSMSEFKWMGVERFWDVTSDESWNHNNLDSALNVRALSTCMGSTVVDALSVLPESALVDNPFADSIRRLGEAGAIAARILVLDGWPVEIDSLVKLLEAARALERLKEAWNSFGDWGMTEERLESREGLRELQPYAERFEDVLFGIGHNFDVEKSEVVKNLRNEIAVGDHQKVFALYHTQLVQTREVLESEIEYLKRTVSRQLEQGAMVTVEFRRAVWGQLVPIERALAATLGDDYIVEKTTDKLVVRLDSPDHYQLALDAVVPLLAGLECENPSEIKSLTISSTDGTVERLAGDDLQTQLAYLIVRFDSEHPPSRLKLTTEHEAALEALKMVPAGGVLGVYLRRWLESKEGQQVTAPMASLPQQIFRAFRGFFRGAKEVTQLPERAGTRRALPAASTDENEQAS